MLAVFTWLNATPRVNELGSSLIYVFSPEKAEHQYGWPVEAYVSNSIRSMDYSRMFGIVRRNGWHIDGLMIDLAIAIGSALAALITCEMLYRRFDQIAVEGSRARNPNHSDGE